MQLATAFKKVFSEFSWLKSLCKLSKETKGTCFLVVWRNLVFKVKTPFLIIYLKMEAWKTIGSFCHIGTQCQ
jgi:hypothetical protein